MREGESYRTLERAGGPRSQVLLNTAHPGPRMRPEKTGWVWGDLGLSHRQPQPPVHTVGIPRPCWPGCSNSSACVVPRSGSQGGPPTCRGEETQKHNVSQRGRKVLRDNKLGVDFQGSEERGDCWMMSSWCESNGILGCPLQNKESCRPT